MDEERPAINVEETRLWFEEKARAGDWRYKCWQAAFRNYIRNSARYGGVVYKQSFDPRWADLLADAAKEGFRKPWLMESYPAYETAFRCWRSWPRYRPTETMKLKVVK